MENIKKEMSDKPNVANLLGMMPNAITELAKVLDFGDKKHGRSGSLEIKFTQEENLNAAARHFLAHYTERADSENNLLHLAPMCVRILMALEQELTN